MRRIITFFSLSSPLHDSLTARASLTGRGGGELDRWTFGASYGDVITFFLLSSPLHDSERASASLTGRGGRGGGELDHWTFGASYGDVITFFFSTIFYLETGVNDPGLG